MKKTVRKVPTEALRVHFGDEASVCEFAEAGDDGKVAVKIKARSRGPVDHWYWGPVIHDMAGMKLSKPRLPLDYLHRHDEVLGALESFDTESGDLVATGFMDAEDERAAEIVRKAKKGVPYEASIYFDPRSVEAEWIDAKTTATVNGQTVRGPMTILRKWTLRGVAVCPYGYDPKTSTRFSHDDCDVDVTLLSHDSQTGEEVMSTNSQPADTGELSEQAGGEPQTSESQAASRQIAGMFGRFLVSMSKFGRTGEEDEQSASELGAGPSSKEPPEKPAEKPSELSDESSKQTPSAPPETSTELGADDDVERPADKKAPGQTFIDRFGLEKGSVYFAQGLSMDEATAEHNKALEEKVEELSARIEAANLGSEEPVSFSGEGKPAGKTRDSTGDSALDAFCANTKLPGRS